MLGLNQERGDARQPPPAHGILLHPSLAGGFLGKREQTTMALHTGWGHQCRADAALLSPQKSCLPAPLLPIVALCGAHVAAAVAASAA